MLVVIIAMNAEINIKNADPVERKTSSCGFLSVTYSGNLITLYAFIILYNKTPKIPIKNLESTFFKALVIGLI